MKPAAAVEMVMSGWDAFLRQREQSERCDKWVRGKQFEIEERKGHDSMVDGGGVYQPDGQGSTLEYIDLAGRSPGNYAGLIVTSLAQTCFLDGVFRPGQAPNTVLGGWQTWQENGFDSRQNALYRGAFGTGLAYVAALPAISRWTGQKTSAWRGLSSMRCAAFYDDEGNDEFPVFAIEGDLQKTEDGDEWIVKLYDDTDVHDLRCKGTGFDVKEWTYIQSEPHNTGVTPVVRYANLLDLDGRAVGEIEPVVPLLRRIDQDVFDRLIVQRFGAWKIRYATGLAKPTNQAEQRAAEVLLKMGELLISSDPNSKFGTLDATDIKGFIEAHDVDLRDLAALTQMPPYHLLGLSSNLQAEALETAKGGLMARSFERKTSFGESHESLFRITAKQKGDLDEMRAFDLQVRWRDKSDRPLSAAADALGKLATQVGVPQQMLFEMIPGWTDYDVQRAVELAESGAVESLFDAISRQGAPVDTPPPPAEQ